MENINRKWLNWQRSTNYQSPSSAIKNEPKFTKYIRDRRNIGENSNVAFQNNAVCRTMSEICVRKINHITNSFSDGKTMLSEGISIWNTPTFFGSFQNEHRSKTNNNSNVHIFFTIWCWMWLRGKSGPKPTSDHSENRKNEKHTRWIKSTHEWYEHYCAHIIWHIFHSHKNSSKRKEMHWTTNSAKNSWYCKLVLIGKYQSCCDATC